MSQFSLYRNENKSSKNVYPYFVDVQNSLLNDLNTRLVIPLSTHSFLDHTAVSKLCPIIVIHEQGNFVLLTHQMTSVPTSILKNHMGSLEDYRYEILSAIDLLLTGI